MAVDLITAAEFEDRIRNAILNRTRTYDTGYGPVRDIIIKPVAAVLADQNNSRLRRISLLISLLNEDEFTEDELDQLVYNEGIIRPDGSQATVTLTFRRVTPFSAGETGAIPRGFPVGTSIDLNAGQTVVFLTTEAKDKTNAIAVLDTDLNQTVYEVQVSAVALIRGSDGKVGANRVNRPLRSLAGYDSVTNASAAQEGKDRYTNAELIDLYLLSVASRQLSVPNGEEFHVRSNFTGVEDAVEVFGTDALLTRAADDAGAVDLYVVGEALLSATDQLTYLGLGQKMILSTPPVVRIDSVSRVGDGEVFTEGDDYEVLLDSSGVSGSTRASDAIRFLPTVSTTGAALAVGDVISITYSYNDLIRQVQADAEDPEVAVDGRDLLVRASTRVDIYLAANLKVLSRFTPSTIQKAVKEAIEAYINGLGGGDDVEASDLQLVVRRLSGVDNFVITRLTDDSTATSEVIDVPIGKNQYARIETDNLTITLV